MNLVLGVYFGVYEAQIQAKYSCDGKDILDRKPIKSSLTHGFLSVQNAV